MRNHKTGSRGKRGKQKEKGSENCIFSSISPCSLQNQTKHFKIPRHFHFILCSQPEKHIFSWITTILPTWTAIQQAYLVQDQVLIYTYSTNLLRSICLSHAVTREDRL